MVRFIIIFFEKKNSGQADLHSNMVRFIILTPTIFFEKKNRFTFQYG